jgi:RNA ligase (TIGR02306 family)
MSTFRVPVVTIKSLSPIQGADKIELAKFYQNDWQIVVQKGHTVGEKVVYIPPDSVFTDEMVAKMDIKYLKNGNRVGAIKLRGTYSFGMVLPCPDGYNTGDDAADFYQITKWVEPEDNRNATRRGAQSVGWKNKELPKYTDIENMLSYLGTNDDEEPVSVTEKVHGSNSQFMWARNPKPAWWERLPFIDRLIPDAGWIFLACSRNNQYVVGRDDNLWTKIAIKYDLPNKLRNFREYAICGEIYGAGVQDLTYGLKTQEFVAFDVYSVPEGKYLDWGVSKSILNSFNLPIVPELYVGPYHQLHIESLVDGKTLVGLDRTQLREGIVIKPLIEKYSDVLHGRKIVKLVSKNYLTRKEGTEHH